MHIAQKFERLLETYRHVDGRRWTGQELDEATGGVVTRSYVTNLRKGRIENPGYEKLRAIAKVMNFSPELWFQEATDSDALRIETDDFANIAQKANHLFKVIRNDTTGESYTNVEVARLSLGDLTEEQIEQIRTGANPDPSVGQLVALADIFGVHPLYFLDRSKKPPVLDQEAMEILRDETLSTIAHKSLHLPDREREMILGIVQQFELMHDRDREE
jgi:transcriptional regulator with XRE-family HTH domain